jgi:hypothetical protein
MKLIIERLEKNLWTWTITSLDGKPLFRAGDDTGHESYPSVELAFREAYALMKKVLA